jgi:arylsulfatase A-like enzyme
MRISVAFAVLLSFVAATGCLSSAVEEPKAPRSVLLVSIEGIRADRLPAYGGKDGLPAFQRLGSAAVVFDDAATAVPMARPAAATLLTGQAPDRLNMRDDISDRLDAKVRTLAQAAREAKASTGAFVSTPFCSYASGFERGFDLFDGPEETAIGPAAFEPPQRPAAEVADHAVQWIRSLPATTPFLAWVHLGTLHGRAVGKDEASAPAEYTDALKEVDGALGKLLDGLGTRPDVDLVVVGTHGTHLGENGRRGAAFWLTAQTLRVPLLWQGPGLQARREARRVWLPDVAPTVAARAGWALPGTEGTDLFAAALGSRERRAWTWAPDDQVAWPNLAVVEREGRWVEDEARPATPRPRVLSEATRVGLVSAEIVPASPSPAGERKPKDEATRTDVLVRLQRLRGHVSAGRPLPAMKQARLLLEAHPDNLGALLQRCFAVIVNRRQDEAVQVGKKLLADFPDRGEAMHMAGHVWYEDRKKAEALVRAAWELGPREPEILYDQACLRALQGDTDGAVQRLSQAIEVGYRDWEHLERDPDLASIRKAPAFAELLRAHGR